MWFPKKKSNILNSMLRQVNDMLGGAYFVLALEPEGYVMLPTELNPGGLDDLSVLTPIKYQTMQSYLSGVMAGLKISKKLYGNICDNENNC